MSTTKLDARVSGFSSIVGGGVQLLDQNGRARFQLAIMGTTDGVTSEEGEAIARRLAELINQNGLEVPRR